MYRVLTYYKGSLKAPKEQGPSFSKTFICAYMYIHEGHKDIFVFWRVGAHFVPRSVVIELAFSATLDVGGFGDLEPRIFGV